MFFSLILENAAGDQIDMTATANQYMTFQIEGLLPPPGTISTSGYADDHLALRQAEAQCEPPYLQAPRPARLSHRQLHAGERCGYRHLRRQRLDAHGV